jgi:hypothetical protein
MGSAAHELDGLRDVADLVVARVCCDLLAVRSGSGLSVGSGPTSAKLVIVGPGKPEEFNASGPVSFASFGREVAIPALVEGQTNKRQLPTPIMVARYLASRDISAHPEHARLWAAALWMTTSGHDAEDLGEQVSSDDADVGLILVADGAACHGPKAPNAQDERSQTYDDGVCEALASGFPTRLAQIDARLGNELGATGYEVWPVLVAAAAAADTKWVGEVLWAGAPYGVGWTVGSWRRPCL